MNTKLESITEEEHVIYKAIPAIVIESPSDSSLSNNIIVNDDENNCNNSSTNISIKSIDNSIPLTNNSTKHDINNNNILLSSNEHNQLINDILESVNNFRLIDKDNCNLKLRNAINKITDLCNKHDNQSNIELSTTEKFIDDTMFSYRSIHLQLKDLQDKKFHVYFQNLMHIMPSTTENENSKAKSADEVTSHCRYVNGKRITATESIDSIIPVEPNILPKSNNISILGSKTLQNETTSSLARQSTIKYIEEQVHTGMNIGWQQLLFIKNEYYRILSTKESWMQCLIEIIDKQVGNENDQKHLHKQANDLRIELIEIYARYELLLTSIKIKPNEPYSSLAYHIMLADCYWYSAKVAFGNDQRLSKYADAKRIYRQLLHKAECSLPNDDNSLLTIANKLLQIGIECNAMIDADTMQLCENLWIKSKQSQHSTNRDEQQQQELQSEIGDNLIVWCNTLAHVQYREKSY